MVCARLETENFTFEAYGKNATDARFVLIGGLELHGTEYRLPKRWYADYLDDVFIVEIQMNRCYRDHEKMRGAK